MLQQQGSGRCLRLTLFLLAATAVNSNWVFGEKLPAPIRDPERRTSKYVQNWSKLKERNVVMQRRDYSCGAAALATVARYYWGDKVDEEFFLDALDGLLTEEEIIDRVKNGLAMSDLRKAAVKVGYQSVVGKVTFKKLTEAKVPLIVGITVKEYDHFVVYRGTDYEWVYLADPIRGNLRIPIKNFLDQWQENAILAIHKPGHKVRAWSPLSVREEEKALGELNRQVIRTFPTRRQIFR